MKAIEIEAQKEKSQHRIHYGWVIVLAGLLITGAGIGIFNSCAGVFIKPICDDLGFSRGQFTLYSSISTLVCVILMPFFGSLFRRFGFRRVSIFGAAVCGMTLIGYSFSSQLWHFYILAFVSGIFVNGVGVMSVGILVNRWFIDKRGLATGIAYSGSGLLAAVLIPITSSFIERNGWQWSYRFLGIVSLVILISIILFVVKDKPEDMGLEPYREKRKDDKELSAQIENSGLMRQEALKTSAYWLLIIAVFGIALCQAGPHVHTVSFLSDIGYSSAFASSVSSVYMLLLTASKIIMGFVFDKLGSLKGSLLIGGCCVLFPVFALLAMFPAFPWAYALVLSVASSGSTILGTILTTNYFGRKDFARVYSVISMSSYLGVAISSPLLGSIYDLTGGYNIAWMMIIGLGIGVCTCLAGTYLKSKALPETAGHKEPLHTGKDSIMKITESTKVIDVISSSHAKGFGKYLFPLEERMPGDDMTLANINPLLPFHNHIHTESTIASIEYLLDTASKGNPIFYRFYSEKEIFEDPQKEDTGLFFFKGKENAPFAVISAGGAFNYVGSIHEGFPYALKLTEAGYNAFVLQYRVGGQGIATEDLAAATSYIIKNREEFGVAEEYSLWGSSAGARMAANIGSHGAAKYGGADIPKPAAVVMLYTAHTDLSDDEVPTFAAIGENDDIVNPPAVMKARVDKLVKMGIPAEYHMYKKLKHGFGLGIGTSAEGWIEDAIRFCKEFVGKCEPR